MYLKTGKVSNNFSGLLCLRIYHVFLCDKNRLEGNSILNIGMLSFVQTYDERSSWSVRAQGSQVGMSRMAHKSVA